MEGFRFELDGADIEAGLHEAGVQLERLQPIIDRLIQELPRRLEHITVPDVRIEIDGRAKAERRQGADS
jgi:hypothetical protein